MCMFALYKKECFFYTVQTILYTSISGLLFVYVNFLDKTLWNDRFLE